jgi:hypothetical protein
MIADGVAAAARRAILAAFSFQLSAISYQPLPASPSAISFQLSAFSFQPLPASPSAFSFWLSAASGFAVSFLPSAFGFRLWTHFSLRVFCLTFCETFHRNVVAAGRWLIIPSGPAAHELSGIYETRTSALLWTQV